MLGVGFSEHRISSNDHRIFQFQYTFITQTNPIKFPFGDVGDVLGFGLGQNQFHTVALQGIICFTNENIATSWATISHVFFHFLYWNQIGKKVGGS